eukprot:gene17934-biopygen24676
MRSGAEAGDEVRALADFIDLFFAMRRDRRAGEQLPICEVWAWLTSALQAEHYEWQDEHGWVQWLLPTMGQGTSPNSCPLTPAEAHVFASDHDLRRRGVRAVDVFMDFLCLHFVSAGTRVRAAWAVASGPTAPRANQWRDRPHKYHHARVTRMLNFVCVLGLRERARAFLDATADELSAGRIQWCQDPFARHWQPCLHPAAPPLAADPPRSDAGRRDGARPMDEGGAPGNIPPAPPLEAEGDRLAIQLGISPRAARAMLAPPLGWGTTARGRRGKCRRGPALVQRATLRLCIEETDGASRALEGRVLAAACADLQYTAEVPLPVSAESGAIGAGRQAGCQQASGDPGKFVGAGRHFTVRMDLCAEACARMKQCSGFLTGRRCLCIMMCGGLCVQGALHCATHSGMHGPLCSALCTALWAQYAKQ